MSMIRSEASAVIDARPEELYAVVSDYRVGHPAILPKPYFTELTVEKGGQGAGTVIRTRMKVFGREYAFHQAVTEPEPGRVLVETDMDTGQFSSFTFEPLNAGKQTRVTIKAENPASPGIVGLLERLTQPAFNRRLFQQELRNLADYVRRKNAPAN
jgi:hypothetical protein